MVLLFLLFSLFPPALAGGRVELDDALGKVPTAKGTLDEPIDDPY